MNGEYVAFLSMSVEGCYVVGTIAYAAGKSVMSEKSVIQRRYVRIERVSGELSKFCVRLTNFEEMESMLLLYKVYDRQPA